MTTFFRPYEGKRPFVFISYSHRNTERVLSIITKLHDGKLRLWYDEGIPAGNDWSSNIDTHMRTCKAVLFFRSKTALASHNCLSEIKTAIEHGHPLLIVPMDDAPVDAQWLALLQHGTTLALPPEAGDEAILSGVLQWKVLNRSFCRKRSDGIRLDRIGLAAAILLLLTASAALYGILSGRIDPFHKEVKQSARPTVGLTPTPTSTETPAPSPTPDMSGYQNLIPVNFGKSRKLEEAVRSAIGRSEGEIYQQDLNGVTELLICGHMAHTDPSGVRFDPDGVCRVGNGKLIEGDVRKLDSIGDMPFLKRLALIRQPIEDLSPLNGLVVLEELWLSGNDIDSIDALTDLPQLHTLHLEHTAVRDLSALSALPALRTVTVSVDMLPIHFDSDAAYRVRIVR